MKKRKMQKLPLNEGLSQWEEQAYIDKNHKSYVPPKIWVDYDVANQCLKKLDALFTYPKNPRWTERQYDFDIGTKVLANNTLSRKIKNKDDLLLNHRHTGMLLIGPANSGKTSILRKFRKNIITSYKGKYIYDEERHQVASVCPIIMISTMPASINILLQNLLYALKTPVAKIRGNKDEMLLMATRALIKAGTRMIILDEFQNILAGVTPGRNQALLMQMLVHFSNAAGVSLVVAGTEDVQYAIGTVGALSSRLHGFRLKAWKPDQNFQTMLGEIAQKMRLECNPPFTSPEVSRRIYTLTEGLLGEVADILTKVAYYHGKNGQVTLEDFENIQWMKPSDRRAGYQD